MHTRISTAEVCLWLVIILCQASISAFMRRRSFLRVYLISEAALGAVLLSIAKGLGAWTYFYSWVAGCFVHEGLAAALLFSLIMAVRRRGLPGRTSALPVLLGAFACLTFGLYTAQSALVLYHNPTWRLLFSWEHAWWTAICCLSGLVPLYAWAISATIPRNIGLTLLGFGAHAIAQAGFLDLKIIQQRGFAHASDVVYLFTLAIWVYASRSQSRETEILPQVPSSETPTCLCD